MGDAHVFRSFVASAEMMDGLRRYVHERIMPGGFLVAVICNDLREAVGSADDENMRNLPAFVDWLYNHAPSNCWGSPEKMAKWLAPPVGSGLTAAVLKVGQRVAYRATHRADPELGVITRIDGPKAEYVFVRFGPEGKSSQATRPSDLWLLAEATEDEEEISF